MPFFFFWTMLCDMWDLSFPIGNQTCAPVHWKLSLNQWTTREFPVDAWFMSKMTLYNSIEWLIVLVSSTGTFSYLYRKKKKETWLLCHPIHKSELQVGYRSSLKDRTIKLLEGFIFFIHDLQASKYFLNRTLNIPHCI